MAIVESAEAHLTVERLRLEWRPGTPVPEPDGRLVFRSFRDTRELLDLTTRALDGTLDAQPRRPHPTVGPRDRRQTLRGGVRHIHESPRLVAVAKLPDTGEAVGFVIPARNSYRPVIAYLGVLPEHRGRGLVDAILAEGTRVLAAQPDVPRIRAVTDVGNVPMAKAFARLGYVNFERAINMAWD